MFTTTDIQSYRLLLAFFEKNKTKPKKQTTPPPKKQFLINGIQLNKMHLLAVNLVTVSALSVFSR